MQGHAGPQADSPSHGAPALLDPRGGRRRRRARARSACSPATCRWSSARSPAGWPWSPPCSPWRRAAAAGTGASTGRRRRAWLLFCLAALSGAVANLWVRGGRSARAAERSSPAGDIFLIVALLLVVAGLVTYPSTPRRGTDLTRMVLDGVVLGGSVLLIASRHVVPADPRTSPARTSPSGWHAAGHPGHRPHPGHGRLAALHPRQSRRSADAGHGGYARFALFAVSDGIAAVAAGAGSLLLRHRWWISAGSPATPCSRSECRGRSARCPRAPSPRTSTPLSPAPW